MEMRKLSVLLFVFVIALFVFPIKSWSLAPVPPEVLIEKQVSIDGGGSWYDADTQDTALIQTACNGAMYRLIITNANYLWKLTNVTVTDPDLGIDQVIADLTDSSPVTLTSADTGFENLDQPGRCDDKGLKGNTATVTAMALHTGYPNATVTASDNAWVNCDAECKASLGDRVWLDGNGNGIQDCEDTNGNGIIGDTGDVGLECSAGIPGVTVQLVDCSSGAVLGTDTTDLDGFYLFENLIPGTYCVKFDLSTVPLDVCDYGLPQFTSPNAGNDSVDSDANPATGVAGPVTLLAGQTNLTVDAGIVCQNCALVLEKNCEVTSPPPGPFVCSNAKPINSITMIWNGTETINIKA